MDLESDPTVFVPYLVRLKGREVHTSAFLVMIDQRGVNIGRGRIPALGLADVESGRIDIRPVPADWHRLRAGYPWVYEPWSAREVLDLFRWARDGLSTVDIAQRLARPPEHVATKLGGVREPVEASGHDPDLYRLRYQVRRPAGDAATHIVHADARERLWYDEDPEPDPTVHLRLVLHLRRRGADTSMAEPVFPVHLSEDGVGYWSARDSGHGTIPLTDVESGWVEIRPVPADMDQLRVTYPAVYERWRPEDALEVLRWGRRQDELPVEWLVERLRRPPGHLMAKYARLEALARAARTPGPRAEPAPYHRQERRVPDEYGVAVHDVAAPAEVAARVGAVPIAVFNFGFFARLTGEQLAALRADPDVDYVQDHGLLDLFGA